MLVGQLRRALASTASGATSAVAPIPFGPARRTPRTSRPARRYELEGDAEVALCWAPAGGGARGAVLPEPATSSRDARHRHARARDPPDPDGRPGRRLAAGVRGATPGGHWSSYPPHKHDRDAMPDESFLEETYYHRFRPAQGFGLQRVYTADGDARRDRRRPRRRRGARAPRLPHRLRAARVRALLPERDGRPDTRLGRSRTTPTTNGLLTMTATTATPPARRTTSAGGGRRRPGRRPRRHQPGHGRGARRRCRCRAPATSTPRCRPRAQRCPSGARSARSPARRSSSNGARADGEGNPQLRPVQGDVERSRAQTTGVSDRRGILTGTWDPQQIAAIRLYP